MGINFLCISLIFLGGLIMSFTQEYQKKLTTADEAVKVVKSGDRLEYGWCVTTPVALDEALAI